MRWVVLSHCAAALLAGLAAAPAWGQAPPEVEPRRSIERTLTTRDDAELKRLREELAAAQAALMSQAGQLQRLQRELEPLRAARAQAEERADAAERRERALQAQLGERGADQDALSAGLAAAQREARDLRARVEAARGEAQRAEADRQASANALAGTRSAQAEVAELRAQVQALQSGSAALREQLAEAQAREAAATRKAEQLDADPAEAAAPRDPLDEGPAQPWMVAAAGAGALLAGAAAGALGARRWRPPKPRKVPVSASVRLGDWSFAVQRAPVSPSFAIRASLASVQMSVRGAVLPLVRAP